MTKVCVNMDYLVVYVSNGDYVYNISSGFTYTSQTIFLTEYFIFICPASKQDLYVKHFAMPLWNGKFDTR